MGKNKHLQKRLKRLIKEMKIKLTKTKIFQYLRHKEMKRYFVVIFSAVFIGLIFGFTTLKILNHVGQPQGVGAITDQNEQTGKSETVVHIPSLQAFIIQGGVFSNEQNFTNWKSRFEKKGLRPVGWYNDGLYYLFLSIGESEQDLLRVKEELLGEGLELYIKKWETKERNIHVDEEEREWMNSFISLWEKSVKEIEDHSFETEWNQFFNDDRLSLKHFQPFKIKIENIFKEIDLSQPVDRHYFLIQLWHTLENEINGNEQ